MNVLIQAGEDAERLAAMFSGLAGVAAELKRVGSLQQAADEAQGRIDKIKTEAFSRAAELEAQVVAAEKRLAGLKEEGAAADRAMAEANASRSKLLASAITEANEIVRLAKEKAAQIASEAVKEAGQHRDATEAALASVKRETAVQEAALVDLNAHLASRQSALDDITAKLADLKSRL